MRLPDKRTAAGTKILASKALWGGLLCAGALGLAGCSTSGGAASSKIVSARAEAPGAKSFGPQADYPVVLGAPYTVQGVSYSPEDVLNYDEVGYADSDKGVGITGAHHTLPLPSYVEVTSLNTGKTILVRVERRGPMTSHALIALSPAALKQLGAQSHAPVRVRRVNPPEVDRFALRSGKAAPARMDTPMSLVAVLKRRLPSEGSVSLTRKEDSATQKSNTNGSSEAAAETPPKPGPDNSSPRLARAVSKPPATPAHAPQSQPKKRPATKPAAKPATKPARGQFVVQAAAFASKANADKAAKALGGFLKPRGRLYLLRKGPFSTRGKANEALAKIKAAGYKDARVAKVG